MELSHAMSAITIAPRNPLPNSPPPHILDSTAIHSAIPTAGHIYVLWDRNTGKVLTMREGKLEMCQPDKLRRHRDNWYWECKEMAGWLSLRQPASGLYVGYELRPKGYRYDAVLIVGKSNEHDRFCYKLAVDGGYQLWWKRDDDLHVVVLDPTSGTNLHLRPSGPKDVVTWEFVQVDDEA
ncbi:hypothetical protein QBC40DRAFT_318533 [Triangularia verruculosa]|uniref:Uncharacterized protein n=1 Tax=Triangularia verruculosa TaxID=2587418 RepID=A0AAN6XRB7_9PEZI|nr:hypothetical protein QBC40DRAFT_318533 [Triangularia verruculosa]